MEPDDRYRLWIERRARAEVPVGFADRVLAAVRAQEQDRQRRSFRGLVIALFSARLGRVGICTLACLACVFRMAWLVALFLPG